MGLELKVEQKQRVYQKQIEQARILQMNAQEIAVYIQEVALENPLIEVEELAEAPLEELVREDMRKSDETGVTASEDTDWSYAGGHQLLEDWWTLQEESLVDIIHQQLLTMPIGEKEKKIVEKLAGSLDSRGYLEISVKKLAEYIPCSVRELRSALEILKSLEPAGIGAADLKECLILQLKRQKDSRLAITLVKNFSNCKRTGRGRGGGKRRIFQNQNPESKTRKNIWEKHRGVCNTRYYCVKRTWKIYSGIE